MNKIKLILIAVALTVVAVAASAEIVDRIVGRHSAQALPAGKVAPFQNALINQGICEGEAADIVSIRIDFERKKFWCARKVPTSSLRETCQGSPNCRVRPIPDAGASD